MAMNNARIAVVTGANKGIGYEIVKGLLNKEKFEGLVYLTARDKCRGMEAVHRLQALNLNPCFHELDVTCQESVDKFADHLVSEHGGIDILVNNAGIYFRSSSKLPFAKQAEKTIETNFFGVLRVCNVLFDLLRPYARVVHLSSRAGHLSWLPSPKLRAQFAEHCLNVSRITCLMNDFVRNARCGTHATNGWGNQPYAISKIGVSALTIVQQKMFDKCSPGTIVNCVHPGDIKTDMTNGIGDFLPEYGAKTPIFLATLPVEECVYKGAYVWYDRRIYDWYGEDPVKLRCPSCKTPCPTCASG